MPNYFKIIVISVIKLYRVVLSPFLPPVCRFYPTCSRYAEEALRRHGLVRGGALAFFRVARCHPFHPGGMDPVPSLHGSTALRRAAEVEEA